MKLEFRVKNYKCCICKKDFDEVLEIDDKRFCESCISRALDKQKKSESKIFEQIQEAIGCYENATNILPTCLYLGRKQFELLNYCPCGTKLYGLTLYRVDIPNHLAVR